MKNLLVVTALVAAFAFGALAQGAAPKVKVLSTPEDATQKSVLLGSNFTNGKKVAGALHPQWDSSGLHYAANSPLAGDGAYELIVSVGMPTFGRSPQYKDLWLKPVPTKFHFKLLSGKVTEVSQPVEEAQK